MWPEGPGVAVKVCGLTVPEEAAACARLGLWGIGVVLADSPRRVDPATAAEVLAAVPDGVARVGVFADASADEIAGLAPRLGLTHVQLHGEADPEATRRATGLPVMQGFRVDGPEALRRADASAADLVLLDAAVPGRHGGTGRPFDWGLLEGRPLGRPYCLAGGLRAGNVAAALTRLRPVMLDVSSGVERAPGRKDLELVRAFVDAVAAAALRAA
jgi:phosphoribosylanthranilate isomerase